MLWKLVKIFMTPLVQSFHFVQEIISAENVLGEVQCYNQFCSAKYSDLELITLYCRYFNCSEMF